MLGTEERGLQALVQRILCRYEKCCSRRRSRRGRRAFGDAGAILGGEQLEARYLLTTFVVDTIEDEIITRLTCPDGKVSLREAILAANHDSQLDRSFGCSSPGSDVPAGSGADTITFSR